MKKKIAVLLLCLVMVFSAFPSTVCAAGRFNDTDSVTLQNTDILGLMGIISDHPENVFRPNDSLTRSEFCKMAVIAMGNGKLERQYKNSSIFPDVRANHWASGYIGVAAKGPGHFIQGFADGTFGPEKNISCAEAITILMRVLGYSDKDCGGLWPEGYFNLAEKAGVTIGGVSRMGTITRAQAVELFVDMMGAETASGIPYYKNLGTNYIENITIVSADGGSGKIKFSNGQVKYMAVPCAISTIIGRRGTAVFDADDKVIMFMPDSLVKSNAPASSAIIVSTSGSTEGFDALSGGSKTYSIYRNGQKIEAKDIKQYDVATYNPSTDTIVLCDSRLNTYYNNCTPSASHPSTITIFDGLELNVLATAQDMLASYKPGMNLTFYFTADGQIAGATNNSSYANMLAAVDENGSVNLICGSALIPVPKLSLDSKYAGRIVTLKEYQANDIKASIETREANLSLSFKDGTCDGKQLADNVMVFSMGSAASENDYPDTVSYSKIDYYRINNNGKIDLVNIRDANAGTVYSGFAKLGTSSEFDFAGSSYDVSTLQVVFGNDSSKISPEGKCYEDINEGDYVCATFRNGLYSNVKKLNKLGSVSKDSFIGSSIVNVGAASYGVDKNCVFYNSDTKLWMEDADSAFAYADKLTLYEYDGIVRMIIIEAVTK